jgi:hypothetical protein
MKSNSIKQCFLTLIYCNITINSTMNKTTAIVFGAILAAGLMVVASYTNSAWAAGTAASAAGTGSASAASGNANPFSGSSASGSSLGTHAAGGLINLCGQSANGVGACSSAP